jgi:hypothetical protein
MLIVTIMAWSLPGCISICTWFDFSNERMLDSMSLAFPKIPVWEPG